MSRIRRSRRLPAPARDPFAPRYQGPRPPPPSALRQACARLCDGPRSLRRRHVELLRWADLAAPHLLEEVHQLALHLIAGLPWLRRPDQLRSARDGADLAGQLLFRHSLPPCFLAVFGPRRCARPSPEDRARVELALSQDAGGGYAAACLRLPGELTRAIYARLLRATAPEPLVLALRRAQVEQLGGPSWLPERLAPHARLQPPCSGRSLVEALCRLSDLEAEGLDHVIDYCAAAWPLRTLRSYRRLRAEAEAWRPRPPSLPLLEQLPAAPSLGQPPEQPGWVILPLETSAALRAEGQALQHCVATYAHLAAIGMLSIWSVRRGEERRLTLELRHSTMELRQIRGLRNRRPDPEELEVVLSWARRNEVHVPAASWT